MAYIEPVTRLELRKRRIATGQRNCFHLVASRFRWTWLKGVLGSQASKNIWIS